MRRLLLITLGALLLVACTDGHASTTTGDHWMGPDGRQAPNGRTLVNGEFPLTIDLKAGADHCGWHNVQFLDVVFPVGAVVTRYTQEFRLRATPARMASPPPDARDSGYSRDGLKLWIADSDSAVEVYIQHADGSFDRWPRAVAPILCS